MEGQVEDLEVIDPMVVEDPTTEEGLIVNSKLMKSSKMLSPLLVLFLTSYQRLHPSLSPYFSQTEDALRPMI